MAATDWDEATFEAHRPLLFSIAYRMLGSASEAEDIVQDAWLRALQDEHADVRSPRAYLTTIVTRLCIDHLRSAERTRTEYPGPWLPEPLAEPNQESAELASSLTTAFLVLLEQLAPTERAVFLLREVFELDFDEIATSVGKSEANTRQILSRARGRSPSSALEPEARSRRRRQLALDVRGAKRRADLRGICRRHVHGHYAAGADRLSDEPSIDVVVQIPEWQERDIDRRLRLQQRKIVGGRISVANMQDGR
jgi:RNA polymerase sigma-70 factor, ECF subfamily